eukprot:543520_1
MTQIGEIANWARLLTECVQCYGTPFKRGKYYRGVKNIFNFTMFAVRFNLPTSTTTDLFKATEFSDGTGLVLELQKYKKGFSHDVFKFNCYELSDFSEEKEVLFFGGDTFLRISSLYEAVGGGWLSYRKYIEPINAILRMIHGLSLKKQKISTNANNQLMM